MRKKKVWRYYCDFCKKSGCSGGHMKKHEVSCTNNPNRVCGMCQIAGIEQQPIKELVTALGKGDGAGVEKLRELAEGCPACMLAAIRQSGIQCRKEDEDGFRSNGVDDFDFKKEKENFWKEIDADKPDYGYYQ